MDQHLRDNKEHAAMQEVMGGTFAQQIICRSVPHRSEKDEEFYQVRLWSFPAECSASAGCLLESLSVHALDAHCELVWHALTRKVLRP